MSDDTELAWAAGLFDGEGSSFVTTVKTGRVRIAMTVAQSGDPTVLDRFSKAVQKGYVAGPYGPYGPDKERKQPRYYWKVDTYDAVRSVADALWPYLSTPKKAQFEVAWAKHLQSLEEKPIRLRLGARKNNHQVKKTHCPQGHEYNEANTYIYQGRRYCRPCNNRRTREGYQRRKA